MDYLVLADYVIATGASLMKPAFRQLQRDFVLQKQQPDGGFGGRQGESDVYYSDFAVRVLDLLEPRCPALEAVSRSLAALPDEPRSITECFNRLNLRRLLVRQGFTADVKAWTLQDVLDRGVLAGGGWGDLATGRLSAYDTFLALLCRGMLESPDVADETAAAAHALQQLACADGGYAQTLGMHRGQTCATAAVAAVLMMAEKPVPEVAVRFLAAMQAQDGGLRAHADAACGDLLSAFTGFLTLLQLGVPQAVDLRALGRFLRTTARHGGGFGATVEDYAADVEYTYYGTALVSVLRSLAGVGGATGEQAVDSGDDSVRTHTT